MNKNVHTKKHAAKTSNSSSSSSSVPPPPSGNPRQRTAANLMTTAPIVVAPDNSLRDAVRRMVDEDVRHLPVVDAANQLVGMLSDRDVRAAVGNPEEWAEGEDSDEGDELTVGSVMTKDPVAITADTPIEDLVETLVAGRFGALPVVDERDRLVGILSYIDVLRALTPEGT